MVKDGAKKLNEEVILARRTHDSVREIASCYGLSVSLVYSIFRRYAIDHLVSYSSLLFHPKKDSDERLRVMITKKRIEYVPAKRGGKKRRYLIKATAKKAANQPKEVSAPNPWEELKRLLEDPSLSARAEFCDLIQKCLDGLNTKSLL